MKLGYGLARILRMITRRIAELSEGNGIEAALLRNFGERGLNSGV
jgi:hypothetical protein